MPQVPYDPNYHVTPDAPTEKKISIPEANPEAFGAQIGAALKTAGGEVSQGGNELFSAGMQQQNLKNEADANIADVGFMTSMGKAEAAYLSTEGKNAVDGLGAYQQNLQDLRTQALAGITNPRVRQMTDQMITRRVGYGLVQAGQHAAQQQKVYWNQANSAKIQASGEAAASSQDEDGFQQNMSAAIDDQRAADKEHGSDPALSDQNVQKVKDTYFSQYALGKSMSDPVYAMSFLRRNQGQMSTEAYAKIHASVQRSAVNSWSRQNADTIAQGGPGGETETQLAFTNHELQNNPRFAGVLSRLKGATDITQATADVAANYEVTDGAPQAKASGDPTKLGNWKGRIEGAQRVLAGQGSQTENSAFQFYQKLGYNRIASAAIVGNLIGESGLNPKASNGGHVGIAQLDSDRQAQYAQFAKTYSPTGQLGTLTEGQLGSAIKQARDHANAAFAGDPETATLAADESENRIKSLYGVAKAQQQDQVKSDYDKISMAANPNPTMGQKPPTNFDQLFNGDPQSKAAFDRLPPDYQRKIQQDMVANAQPRNVSLNPDGIRHMEQYRWLAATNPDAYRKMSLQSDMFLTKEQVSQAIQWQVNPPKIDDQTHTAVELARPTFRSTGMPVTGASTPDFDHFRGAVAAEVQMQQQQKQRQLTSQELTDIGNNELKKVVVPRTGIMGSILGNSEDYTFNRAPTDAQRAGIRQQLTAQRPGLTVSDSTIDAMWRHRQMFPAPSGPQNPQLNVPSTQPQAPATKPSGPAAWTQDNKTSTLDEKDISAESTYPRKGEQITPSALIIHHTAMRGTPDQVVQALNDRGLGTQFIVDRDGTIYKGLPDGSRGAQIQHNEEMHLSNDNTFGAEFIARDDKDITPQQVAAGKKLYAQLKEKYPNIDVHGHGFVNPGHKQATEGKTIADAIRVANGKTPDGAPGNALDAVNKLASATQLSRRGFLGNAYAGDE